MWLSHPIRTSKYSYINRFDLIVALARAMRGNHFYYLSAENQALYGIPEEPYAVREIKLPPELYQTASFIFRIDTMDLEILNQYLNFVLFDDMPWALIPAIHLDDAIDYTPFFKPVSDTKLWTIINSVNRAEVEFLDLYGPDGKKSSMLPLIRDIFSSFFNSRNLLMNERCMFYNMERSTIVQDVFASKANMGEKYLPLWFNDRNYSIFLFKNLFYFNKNDLLTIEGRNRVNSNKVFELRFEVIHDKNPIKYIIPESFTENTYATFVRLN